MKDSSTSIGLPEVMLGLLPGGGGLTRLPKLVALPQALDMVLTGRTLKADKAKKLGVVDAIVEPLGPGLKPQEERWVGTESIPSNVIRKIVLKIGFLRRNIEYLEEVAVQTASSLANGTLKVDRAKKGLVAKVTDFVMGIGFVRDKIFEKARGTVMKQTNGLYPAPLKVRVSITGQTLVALLTSLSSRLLT